MTDMPRYRSHKIVQAATICAYNSNPPSVDVLVGDLVEQIAVPGDFFARGIPAIGGYLVIYPDGYMSWSPKQAFEDGYTAVTEDSD